MIDYTTSISECQVKSTFSWSIIYFVDRIDDTILTHIEATTAALALDTVLKLVLVVLVYHHECESCRSIHFLVAAVTYSNGCHRPSPTQDRVLAA